VTQFVNKTAAVYAQKTELDVSLKWMANRRVFRIRILADKGIFLCASTFKTCLEHIGGSYRWVKRSGLSRWPLPCTSYRQWNSVAFHLHSTLICSWNGT